MKLFLNVFGFTIATLFFFNSANANNFVSITGGYGELLEGDSSTTVAGANNNGSIRNIEGKTGWMGSFSVGTYVNKNFAVDLSYTEIKDKIKWQGLFPGPSTTEFFANTSSQLIMLNGTYFFNSKDNADETKGVTVPFISFGVGQSTNELQDTEEYFGGALTATLYSDEQETSTAYKVGLGVETVINDTTKFIIGVDYYNLGDFRTANTRNRIAGGAQAIGPWIIEDVTSTRAFIGLKKSF